MSSTARAFLPTSAKKELRPSQGCCSGSQEQRSTLHAHQRQQKGQVAPAGPNPMGPTPLAKSFKTQPPAPNRCCVLGALRDEAPLLPPRPPAAASRVTWTTPAPSSNDPLNEEWCFYTQGKAWSKHRLGKSPVQRHRAG